MVVPEGTQPLVSTEGVAPHPSEQNGPSLIQVQGSEVHLSEGQEVASGQGREANSKLFVVEGVQAPLTNEAAAQSPIASLQPEPPQLKAVAGGGMFSAASKIIEDKIAAQNKKG